MSQSKTQPEASESSTKLWYSEPGSTRTNPIMIDDETSTKLKAGTTKTNPIIFDEECSTKLKHGSAKKDKTMIKDESSPTIQFGGLLEELTYATAWPAPSGQEAELPKALELNLDECYRQEAERSSQQGTGANDGSQITPDYLVPPYSAIDSPPVAFGSPVCELVVRDAPLSDLNKEYDSKVVKSDFVPSGSTSNPIVIHVEPDVDRCDSDADTEIMTSPEFWANISKSPSTMPADICQSAKSQSAKIGLPQHEDLQMTKTLLDSLELDSLRDTKNANCEADFKECPHAEAPTTKEIFVHKEGAPRFSRPLKHKSSHQDVPVEPRRSKRLCKLGRGNQYSTKSIGSATKKKRGSTKNPKYGMKGMSPDQGINSGNVA